tara:strand:+ start:544 stop:852 length:309 start_codon:yes stop_codon:yes gene_type:complete
MKKEDIVGKCPICNRDMIAGPSIDEHHFIPKSRGGKSENKILIHSVCHQKLHQTFTNKELEKEFNTPEKCVAHPMIKKFIKFISKKHPEYKDKNIKANRKKK